MLAVAATASALVLYWRMRSEEDGVGLRDKAPEEEPRKERYRYTTNTAMNSSSETGSASEDPASVDENAEEGPPISKSEGSGIVGCSSDPLPKTMTALEAARAAGLARLAIKKARSVGQDREHDEAVERAALLSKINACYKIMEKDPPIG